MDSSKGSSLEELVRSYFALQGYFAIRSVQFKFETYDVTDIDVWLYSKQTASTRIRAIVDVKNKRSPKTFERILWVKGLQEIIKCDRAIIATTDNNPILSKFATENKISLISKSFIDRLEKRIEAPSRIPLEEFIENLQKNPAHKQDGDWIKIIQETKSALVSLPGFSAFNKAMFAFKFFADRAEVRTIYGEQIRACLLAIASLACIALDSALEELTFEESQVRFDRIKDGIIYGSMDGKFKQSLTMALGAISESINNGKAVAAHAKERIDEQLSLIRADLIAEFFVRDINARQLFATAVELDNAAYSRNPSAKALSVESKSIIGVFCDYLKVKRSILQFDTDPSQTYSEAKNSRKKHVQEMQAQDLNLQGDLPLKSIEN